MQRQFHFLRKDKSRTLAFFSLFLVGLLVLTACGQGGGTGGNTGSTGSTGGQAPEKIVSIGLTSAPQSLNPIQSVSATYTRFVNYFLYDTLVSINDKQEFTPRLALSWEPSPESDAITFSLDPKAKWTDGTPITTDDVLWTFNTYSHPQANATHAALLRFLKGVHPVTGLTEDGTLPIGVTAIDPHTVRFDFREPYDPNMVLEILFSQLIILPSHVLKDVPPDQLGQAEFFVEPNVTSGPFQFVKLAPNQYVEVKKNPDYHLGEPKLDRIVFRAIQGSTIVAALQSGTIHTTADGGVGSVPIDDWELAQTLDNVTTKQFSSNNFSALFINNELPQFSDVRVRQAINHAVNRERLVTDLLQGLGSVACSPFIPGTYYHTDVKCLEYNPEKAKQLLQEAGWDFDQEVTVDVSVGNPVRQRAVDLIVQDLNAVGMKANVQTMDFAQSFARLRSGDYEMGVSGYPATLDPDWARNFFREGAPFNVSRWVNAEANALWDEAAATVAPDERKKLYDRLQEILVEDPPALFMYYDNALVAHDSRLVNVNHNLITMAYNPWEWDIQQ